MTIKRLASMTIALMCLLILSVALTHRSQADGWYDSYGELPWEEEVLHLDNFGIDLRRYPNYVGYVALYFRRNERPGRVKARIERVRKYLVYEVKIDKNRLKVIDAGRKNHRWTILQPVDKDKPPPSFGQ